MRFPPMNLFIFNDFWLKNICRLYIRRNLNGVLLHVDLDNEGHRDLLKTAKEIKNFKL